MHFTQNEPFAVNVPEACRISGIGRSKLYELFQNGEIKPRKCGKRTLVLLSDLKAFVESLPVAA